MITKFGKRFLVSYLAGNTDFTSKELALGIGDTSPNAKGNDTKLAFEFYRVPITLGSIDISQTGTDVDGDPVFSYIAIFQGTISQDVAGVRSEIGLYPSGRASQGKYDSKFINTMDNNILWKDSGGFIPALRINLDAF